MNHIQEQLNVLMRKRDYLIEWMHHPCTLVAIWRTAFYNRELIMLMNMIEDHIDEVEEENA